MRREEKESRRGKATKALLKAQKAAEKAEKAKKAEEAKERSKLVRSESHKETESPSTSNNTTSLLGKRNQSRRNNSKRPHLEDTADVNDNQCCVCFDEYVEGDLGSVFI